MAQLRLGWRHPMNRELPRNVPGTFRELLPPGEALDGQVAQVTSVPVNRGTGTGAGKPVNLYWEVNSGLQAASGGPDGDFRACQDGGRSPWMRMGPSGPVGGQWRPWGAGLAKAGSLSK